MSDYEGIASEINEIYGGTVSMIVESFKGGKPLAKQRLTPEELVFHLERTTEEDGFYFIGKYGREAVSELADRAASFKRRM